MTNMKRIYRKYILCTIMLVFTSFLYANTTVDKLKIIKDSGTEIISKQVASAILNNWNHDTINKSRKVGFWWHDDHVRDIFFLDGIQIGQEVNGGVDRVYAHAYSNPISQPNGPWHIRIVVKKHHSDKSKIIYDFEKAGFIVTRTDGSDRGGGGKSINFKDPG